jgi:hypothetical protein
MSDLKILESQNIAKLSSVATDLSKEMIVLLNERDSAISELKRVKEDIKIMAAKAAKEVWCRERAMLNSKIDGLERENRRLKEKIKGR